MEVKGFEKTNAQHHSRVSSKTGESSSSEQEDRNMSAIGTIAIADSQFTATTTEDDVTLDANQMPVVAEVFNEACVSSNSFNSVAYVTGSKENLSVSRNLDLSGTVGPRVNIDPPHVALHMDHAILSSYETQSSPLSTAFPTGSGAAIDQGTHRLHNEDKAIGEEDKHVAIDQGTHSLYTEDKTIAKEDKHIDTARRGILTTGINLDRGNRSRVKTGRWTRLHSRVGVNNLQTNTFNRSSTKQNFSGTFGAVVVDTENEKKPKFEENSDEQEATVFALPWMTELVLQQRWLPPSDQLSEAHHLHPFVDAWNIPRKSLQPMLVAAKAFYHKRLELKVIKKRQMSKARLLNPFFEAWNPNKPLQPMLMGAKAIVNTGLELTVTEKR
nr:hypothetical protein CFP56_50754 [Quercus suber]